MLIARLAPDNSLADRVAMLPAIVAALASATEQAADWVGVTGSTVGDQTALEAGTSAGVAEETETHSAEVPEVLGDSTDRARVPAATAVPPAWDPEVEASEGDVAVAAGAGKRCL